MIIKEKSIVINTSPEMIWEMLSSDKIPEWQPYMAKNKRRQYITKINEPEDKYKSGTTMLFDGDCHYKVLESVKNRQIVYHIYEKSFLGNLGGKIFYLIEPLAQGCKFTIRQEMYFPNKFVETLVGNPITMFWFNNQLKSNVESLKNILEKSL